MENQGSKSRSTLMVVAVVLGGGMLLFILLLVLPAVFFLSREEPSGTSTGTGYESNSQEIEIPAGDSSQATDFFDDLED